MSVAAVRPRGVAVVVGVGPILNYTAREDPSQANELTGHSTALFITVPTMADLNAIEARGDVLVPQKAV